MSGFRVLFFFVGLVITWVGGQKTLVAVRDREPTAMTLMTYEQSGISAAWLSLAECQVSPLDAAYLLRAGEGIPREVFIPVRPVGRAGGPVNLLLQTSDPKILSLVSLQHDQSPAAMNQIATLLRENSNRQINGLVQSTFDVTSKDRDKLFANISALGKDVVIIKEGASPSLGVGLATLTGGLGVLAISIFSGQKSKVNSLLPPGVPPPKF